MNLNFYPFTIVNKFEINNKYIDKLTDKEILEYLFIELKKESYDRIVLNEASIEIDEFYELYNKRILPPRSKGIKNGRIWIETYNSNRILMFKYQIRVIEIIPFFLIPLLLAIFGSVFGGICFFIFLFLLFLFSIKFIKLNISSLIEKLADEEFRKELNRRRSYLL